MSQNVDSSPRKPFDTGVGHHRVRFASKDSEDVKKQLGFQQWKRAPKDAGAFLTRNVLITRFSLNFLFKKPASDRIDDAVDHAARLPAVLALKGNSSIESEALRWGAIRNNGAISAARAATCMDVSPHCIGRIHDGRVRYQDAQLAVHINWHSARSRGSGLAQLRLNTFSKNVGQ